MVTSRVLRSPARWFREIGAEIAHERGLYNRHPRELTQYLLRERAKRVATLSAQLKNVRDYFHGFEAAEGYDLRDLPSWPYQKVRKLQQRHLYLANLQSQEFKRVTARTKAQRRGLQHFTGELAPDLKAFVVHVASPRDRVQVTSNGRVIITRSVGRATGVIVMDHYLFMTLIGWRPVTWDELIEATEEMLPLMPDGRYFILSELHDLIDVAHEKRMLLRLIQRYAMEYNMRDFAQTIIGYRRFTSRLSTDAVEATRYKKRVERKQTREKAYRKWHKKAVKRFAGKHGKKPRAKPIRKPK